jgi:carboxypeptidase T
LTESPVGNYTADLNISTTLRALNFTGATSAQVSFWARYQIEDGYDYMFLEVSTNGTDWGQIASFTGNQLTWGLQTYSLDNYINETNVIIRFRFMSDSFVEEQGMFIDDLEVSVSGVGLDEGITSPLKTNLLFNPNPTQKAARLNFWLENSGLTKILLTDSKGMLVKTLVYEWKEAGTYSLEMDFSGLPSGVYYGILESNSRKISRKLIISR